MGKFVGKLILVGMLAFGGAGFAVAQESPSEGKIMVNEFMANPEGTDTGKEWLELYNSGEVVDLSGWKVQVAGQEFKEVYNFPAGSSIAHGQYLLICEADVQGCDYNVSKLGMQNGDTDTDGIRLIDKDGNVVDTVLYGKPNKNNLANDLGEIEKDENCAPKPESGKSIGRKNFIDTDNSWNDFEIFSEPSPGGANKVPDFTRQIFISEVAYAPNKDLNDDSEINSSDDYLEIYRVDAKTSTIDWYIKKSQESSKKYALPFADGQFILLNKVQSGLTLANDSECFYLYSPDGKLQDNYCYIGKNIPTDYSECRIGESLLGGAFSKCNFSPEENNSIFQPKLSSLKDISSKLNEGYGGFCSTHKIAESEFVIEDNSSGQVAACSLCEINKCYIAKLKSKNGSPNDLEVLDLVSIDPPEIQKQQPKHIQYDDISSSYFQQSFMYGFLIKQIDNYKIFKVGNNYVINNEILGNTNSKRLLRLDGIPLPYTDGKTSSIKIVDLKIAEISSDENTLAITGESIGMTAFLTIISLIVIFSRQMFLISLYSDKL